MSIGSNRQVDGESARLVAHQRFESGGSLFGYVDLQAAIAHVEAIGSEQGARSGRSSQAVARDHRPTAIGETLSGCPAVDEAHPRLGGIPWQDAKAAGQGCRLERPRIAVPV